MRQLWPNQDVPYDAIAATPGRSGDTYTYLWDFDDGSAANSKATTHPYVEPGVHTATVRAADIQTGARASASVEVDICVPDTAGPHDFTFTMEMPDSQSAVFAVDLSTCPIADPHFEWHKIENGVDTVIGTDSATLTTESLVYTDNAQKRLRFFFETRFYVVLNGKCKSREATLFVETPNCNITGYKFAESPQYSPNVSTDPPINTYYEERLSTDVTGMHSDAISGLTLQIWGNNHEHDGVDFYVWDTGSYWHYQAGQPPVGPPLNGDPIPHVAWGYAICTRGIGMSPFVTCPIWRVGRASDGTGNGIWTLEDHGPSSELPYAFEYLEHPAWGVPISHPTAPLVVTIKAKISRLIFDVTRVRCDPKVKGALIHVSCEQIPADAPQTLTYTITCPPSAETTLNPCVYVR